MKHILVVIVCLFSFMVSSVAQNNGGKFDMEKYNRELETAVIKAAKLTNQESQEFIPLFREMHHKLRELYRKQKHCHKVVPTDEASALQTIKDFDNVDLEIHKLQQCYHNRFLKFLSPTKVLAIIKAEERYNRSIMKSYANKRNENKPNTQK